MVLPYEPEAEPPVIYPEAVRPAPEGPAAPGLGHPLEPRALPSCFSARSSRS